MRSLYRLATATSWLLWETKPAERTVGEKACLQRYIMLFSGSRDKPGYCPPATTGVKPLFTLQHHHCGILKTADISDKFGAGERLNLSCALNLHASGQEPG